MYFCWESFRIDLLLGVLLLEEVIDFGGRIVGVMVFIRVMKMVYCDLERKLIELGRGIFFGDDDDDGDNDDGGGGVVMVVVVVCDWW